MEWILGPALATLFLGTPNLVAGPWDLSGFGAGATAVFIDPTGAARADGFELHLRSNHQAAQPGDAHNHLLGDVTYGAAAVLPFNGLSLAAGYAWGLSKTRGGAIGLALATSHNAYLGVMFHHQRLDAGQTQQRWELGVAGEPSRWLSWALSLGIRPRDTTTWDNTREEARAGLALRPFAGSEVLTIGLEYAGSRRADLAVLTTAPRFAALLDTSFLPSTHVFVSGERQGDAWRLWSGLSVSLFAGPELIAAASSGDDGERLRGGLALNLRAAPTEPTLAYPTVEVPLGGDLRDHSHGWFQGGEVVSSLVPKLDALGQNPAVERVVLAIGQLDVGLAMVAELRAAIHRLRHAGKVVVAELGSADERGYMVAAAADEVVMDPFGTLTLDGFAMTVHYVGDSLANFGVRFEQISIGRYKSGADPLTRGSPRPEDQEVYQEIVTQAYAQLRAVLRNDRQLDPKTSDAIAAERILTAPQALAYGLVDALSPPPGARATPPDVDKRIPYAATVTPSPLWGMPPVIAVVGIAGPIVMQAGNGFLSSDEAVAPDIAARLEALRVQSRVAGVVLRIDSPGGDVVAAELIWRAVKRLAAAKPVVASFGDVAASGGYYVATAAHCLFAEPATLTGSIGIFSLHPDVSGLLAMAQVGRAVYAAPPDADWMSATRPLDAVGRHSLERLLQHYYDAFVDRVAEGRQLSRARTQELAQGRVYTGAEAVELTLVDKIGGIAEAIAEVARRAQVQADHEVDWPRRPAALALLGGRLGGLAGTPSALSSVLAAVARLSGRPLALMPSLIEY